MGPTGYYVLNISSENDDVVSIYLDIYLFFVDFFIDLSHIFGKI